MKVRFTVLLLAAGCLACATAPRSGDTVHIAEESAIIVWDAASKTQHFFRRASFDTQAKDFGFLVPTPSVPELKEAKDGDAAFVLLDQLTTPPQIQEATKSLGRAPAPAAAPAVVVLERKRVAGFDAAVLKASNARALDGWLKHNGYHSSPKLMEWFKPYVAKNWIITAFKIAGDGGRLETSALRMSFQTDVPFFPYREPESKSVGGPRLLKVYFIGDFRPEGKIGSGGAWPGRTTYSEPLSADMRNRVLKLLGLPESKGATRLTRLEDRSSPRPGKDDVYFLAAR